jgi:hypothetical protein
VALGAPPELDYTGRGQGATGHYSMDQKQRTNDKPSGSLCRSALLRAVSSISISGENQTISADLSARSAQIADIA